MTPSAEQPVPQRFRDSGTSRAERLPAGLLPANLLLDARTPLELLAYLARFSDDVQFYTNPTGPAAGSWALAQHRSLLLLALAATQPSVNRAENIEAQLAPLQAATASPAQQRQARQTLLGLLHREARRITSWRSYYGNDSHQKGFASALETTWNNLQTPLSQAVRYEALLLAEQAIDGPAQLTGELTVNLPTESTTTAAADEARYQQGTLTLANITQQLAAVFRRVQKELDALATVAERAFYNNLVDYQDHHPEVALLVAFVQLFGQAQRVLNDIPRRHLDYYYQQVLRTGLRASTPDEVNLVFTLPPGLKHYYLPAGTVVGGKDAAGQPVYFATLTNADLHTWRVAALATLFVACPTPNPVADTVTGVYASAIVDPATGAGPEAAGGTWALFGEDQALRRAGSRTQAAGEVGFAVAAPVLDLREGQREITLRVQATADSFATCWQLLNKAVPLVGVAEAVMLQTMFEATITGPAGWLPLTTLAVVADPATHTLTWKLLLGREQPAAVGYAPGTHGGRYTTAAPLLRLLLNPQAPVYGYSYWATLQPLVVQLDVAVQHLRQVELSNQLGALDSRKPFYPFGAQAGPGTELLVGVPEVPGKKLTDLTLALTWQNLPPEGFAKYYTGYGGVVDNYSFTVTVSYLADYSWRPDPAQRPVQQLFAAAAADGPLATTALLHLKQPGYLDPSSTSHAGLVRIELVGPHMGFGASSYPESLANAVRYNAHHAARPRPVPQPPLVPMLSQLTVSYHATERLFPSQGPQGDAPGDFYHITPFAEYEPSAAGPLTLLPTLPAEGTLYVGLDLAAASQQIDLVFDLTPPAQPDQELPVVQWAYLDQDAWHPINQDFVHQHALPGFANTCRVRVTLPATLGLANRILPNGLYWLCATVATGAASFGQVQGIYWHLVRARRTNTGPAPSAPYQQPLAPFSLTQLPQPLPGIKGVTQAQASFGGRPAEDQLTYYARVGEQLRHRGRALTPWDYERLVLNQFPAVYAAKCLTADQLPPPRVPGLVWVVVLPYPGANTPLPLFGAGELAEMQQYLQACASPAVQVLARNPTYEQVQVHATVAFQHLSAGPPPTSYRQQIEQDLAAFLSPWHQAAAQRGGFHHYLTVPAIEAFLTQLPYVAGLTSFSVVKTGLVEDRHRFYDSAADAQQPPQDMGRLVPWAVLVPAAEQAIKVLKVPLSEQAPQPTGIGSLRIEQDFVVACDF